MRSALRHCSSASTTGCVSRKGASTHLRVLGTTTPTDARSSRTCSGFRRSVASLPGTWPSTCASRRARISRACTSLLGRGPAAASIRRVAASRSTGRPSRASSTHSRAAADSEWAVATARALALESSASCRSAQSRAACSPGEQACLVHRPRRRAHIRAQVAVGAQRRARICRAVLGAVEVEQVASRGPRERAGVQAVGGGPGELGRGVPPADGHPVRLGDVPAAGEWYPGCHQRQGVVARCPPRPPRSATGLDLAHQLGQLVEPDAGADARSHHSRKGAGLHGPGPRAQDRQPRRRARRRSGRRRAAKRS